MIYRALHSYEVLKRQEGPQKERGREAAQWAWHIERVVEGHVEMGN